MYPIGPVTRQTDDQDGCVTWLDAQPDGSVLFVSFGSGGADVRAGARAGGERAPVPVGGAQPQRPSQRRQPGGELLQRVQEQGRPAELPPAGVQGVGYVVPSWAPQARVLVHRAMGAMLTHCSWNSVLESVARGVPMIAWPLYAEQRQNAVMLCEETRVALRPKARGSMVLAEDAAEVVREMMDGDKGELARARVSELQEAARKGLQPGGASYETLAQVVSIWRKE